MGDEKPLMSGLENIMQTEQIYVRKANECLLDCLALPALKAAF